MRFNTSEKYHIDEIYEVLKLIPAKDWSEMQLGLRFDSMTEIITFKWINNYFEVSMAGRDTGFIDFVVEKKQFEWFTTWFSQSYYSKFRKLYLDIYDARNKEKLRMEKESQRKALENVSTILILLKNRLGE